MSILSDYKIIKKLGSGLYGQVYLIQSNKKNKYALKIEPVEKKNLKPNAKSELWTEINFYLKFAPKYPDQFIQLIEYDFISNFNKAYFDSNIQIINSMSNPKKNKLLKLYSSKYCVRKIFTLVDGNLLNIIKKLEIKQIYSCLIQLAWIIQLLHSNNYVHGDIHEGNIGWIKTTKKYINLDGLDIPTFGYQIKVIDMGLIMSKSNLNTKKEKTQYEQLFLNELEGIKYCFVDRKYLYELKKNNIKFDSKSIMSEFKKMDEYKIINKIISDKSCEFYLFELLFPEQCQKLLFGTQYKKTIQHKYYLPIEDILVYLKISSEPKLVIKYFYDKIKLLEK